MQTPPKAYQRALELDRDLMEAISIWVAFGCRKATSRTKAVAEFTAYTLQKGEQPEGSLKLRLAQLRTHDLLPAEKVQAPPCIEPDNAEAYDGLGLARMERGRKKRRNFFRLPLNIIRISLRPF